MLLETKKERAAIINVGGDKAVDKDGGSVESEGEVEGGSPGDVVDMGMRMAPRFLT